MRGLFKKWYDVNEGQKRSILGSGTGDVNVKEVVITGRTLKFTEMGLEHTADGKRRGTIWEELGLEPETQWLGVPDL